MLRVLQLGPWAPPHGGVQTHLAAIHEALLAGGATSRVINIAHARKDFFPNVYFPRNAFTLAARLLSVPADIVHLHVGDLRPLLIGLAAFITALPRSRSVLTLHSGRYAAPHAKSEYRFAGALAATLNRFDALICVNTGLVDFLLARGVLPAKLHLIGPHPGVPQAPLPPLAGPVAAFAAMHHPLIVAVGLLEPEYNIPFLFDALARLRAHHPGAGLIVVGMGSLAATVERAHRNHPERGSILLAGDLPRELTLAAVARSTVMLRATSWDGDSISVREAVDLGVPVVASDNRLRPHQVRCYQPGDLDDCLARLLECIREGPLAPPAMAAPPTTGVEMGNIEQVIALYEGLSGLTATRSGRGDSGVLAAGTKDRSRT